MHKRPGFFHARRDGDEEQAECEVLRRRSARWRPVAQDGRWGRWGHAKCAESGKEAEQWQRRAARVYAFASRRSRENSVGKSACRTSSTENRWIRHHGVERPSRRVTRDQAEVQRPSQTNSREYRVLSESSAARFQRNEAEHELARDQISQCFTWNACASSIREKGSKWDLFRWTLDN